MLSLDEAVSFIFSHSALKEGWDNPNVFQICTLNQTVSENKKRQEIGRGLRIPVDQNGQRIFDEDVNILTVVANESYERYVSLLQTEYVEDGQAAPPAPSNIRTAGSDVTRRDNLFNTADFADFWAKLSQAADYRIRINTDELVERCVERINNERFPTPRIVVQSGEYVRTEFTLTLLQVRTDVVRIKLTIDDTRGAQRSDTREYSIKDDLARIHGEPRLRGFKLAEISHQDDESTVTLDNDTVLHLNEPFCFETETGQRVSETATRAVQTYQPVFNLIDRAARETNLTRATVNLIFKGLSDATKERLLTNPEGFAGVFIKSLNRELAIHIAERIEFVLTDRSLPLDIEEVFPPVQTHAQKELVPAGENGLYDQMQTDSGVEQNFVAERLKDNGRVITYFKFPSKFRIPFPKIIGNYNPDWGVLWRNDAGEDVISLVRETKGSEDVQNLQWEHEKRKVEIARRYFQTLGIDYRAVSDNTTSWWEPGADQDPLEVD